MKVHVSALSCATPPPSDAATSARIRPPSCSSAGLLALAALWLSACGASLPTVLGHHEALRQRILQAKSMGAMVCAPQDLATAQASFRLATLEIDQGDTTRAEDHLHKGLDAADRAVGRGAECGVRAPSAAPDAAPADDTDGDGVADAADRCPYELEDRDRHQDDDGCVDPDNDGDGVLDGADTCAGEAEDKDGWNDTDGCPDPDNDGDGVLDAADRCPDRLETTNGFDDKDGCPDFAFQSVVVDGGRVLLPQPPVFSESTGLLMGARHPALDELSAWMLFETAARLRIDTHWDNKGDPLVIQKLCQQQAESLAAYLHKQGVPPGRIAVRGIGGDQPVATNRTESGRAQNRRVEIFVEGLPERP